MIKRLSHIDSYVSHQQGKISKLSKLNKIEMYCIGYAIQLKCISLCLYGQIKARTHCEN